MEMAGYDPTAVGQRIQKQRKALGLTQQSVYERLDTSQNHYSRIENGHIGMSFDLLLSLCEVLDLSADYILTGKAENSSCPDFVAKFQTLSPKQQEFIMKQMDALKEMEPDK